MAEQRAGVGKTGLPPRATPNPYEDPFCQETNVPYERILSFFSAFRGWRSWYPESCSDFISLGRCSTSVPAPNTY
jgi:hypothetical protein